MYQTIYDGLEDWGILFPSDLIAYALTLVAIAFICFILRTVARAILVGAAGRANKTSGHAWLSALYKHHFFHRMSNVVIPIVLTLFREGTPKVGGLLDKAMSISVVCVFLLLFDSLVKAVDEIYQQHEVSRTRPIKSVLQVAEIVVVAIGGVVAAAILVNQSVTVLLGSVTAMTAVTSVIFRDAILGFVAGIQLVINDMIRIGDWIEMPKYSADGTVIELSMTTVKVENFNKTITSIPAYALVSDAFINWRGMENAGGRRIKRAVYIDASCVRLCDDEMLARFRKIELLREYLDGKLAEVEQYNTSQRADLSNPVNGRRLTNIGTFRAYILAYLKQHPGIHQEMTAMVRQLTPDERGLPLELYCFTNTVQWAGYEGIQSDIFDHLYAVAPEFGLRIYQRPSSGDIRMLGERLSPSPPG